MPKQFSKSKREAVYRKCNGRCYYCGVPLHNNYRYPEIPADAEIQYLSDGSVIVEFKRVPGMPEPMDDEYLQIDHVVPRSEGGSNRLENLVAACRPCNCSKGPRSLERYREYITWRQVDCAKFTECQIAFLKANGVDFDSLVPEPVRFYGELASVGQV